MSERMEERVCWHVFSEVCVCVHICVGVHVCGVCMLKEESISALDCGPQSHALTALISSLITHRETDRERPRHRQHKALGSTVNLCLPTICKGTSGHHAPSFMNTFPELGHFEIIMCSKIAHHNTYTFADIQGITPFQPSKTSATPPPPPPRSISLR